MSSALDVLPEVRQEHSLHRLHPLKLDRWHRTLLDLPEPIYLQYGAGSLLEHVIKAAAALEAMVDLLGDENLPTTPQELGRRAVGAFRWYLHVIPQKMVVEYQVDWDKKRLTWELSCSEVLGTLKTAASLEQAYEKSTEWTNFLS